MLPLSTLASRCFLIITFALATAMRRGELTGLRWSDIDFDEKEELSARSSLQTILC